MMLKKIPTKVCSLDFVALFNVPRRREIRTKPLIFGITGLFYEDEGPAEIQEGLQTIFNQRISLSGKG